MLVLCSLLRYLVTVVRDERGCSEGQSMDDTTHSEEAWSIVLAPTQDGWKVRCLCHGSRRVEDGAHMPTVGAHGSGSGPVADRGLPHTLSLHDRWHHVSRRANPWMSLSPRPVAWSELSRSPRSALHVESGILCRSSGGGSGSVPLGGRPARPCFVWVIATQTLHSFLCTGCRTTL